MADGLVLGWPAASGGVTPPTLVSQHPDNDSYGVTSPHVLMNAVSVSASNVIVVVSGVGWNYPLSISENGAGTASLLRNSAVDSAVNVYAHSYIAPSSETLTLSLIADSDGSTPFGGNALRFSGSIGIGASAINTGASGQPSVNITTQANNSAIVVVSGDTASASGSQVFSNNGGAGSPTDLTDLGVAIAIAYYPNAGVAGSKTVGMSSPTGQTGWAIIAVEVKGTP